MLSVIRIGFSVWIQRRASLRTALSAQPPPTHPMRILPRASINAFDPDLAEEEPCVRTIVATAKDSLREESSAALAKKSIDQDNCLTSFASVTTGAWRKPNTISWRP